LRTLADADEPLSRLLDELGLSGLRVGALLARLGVELQVLGNDISKTCPRSFSLREALSVR
jgi:hypothetical protein